MFGVLLKPSGADILVIAALYCVRSECTKKPSECKFVEAKIKAFLLF